MQGSTGGKARKESYGPNAGDAAIQAARRGNLELRNVSFSYPLRPNMAGLTPHSCLHVFRTLSAAFAISRRIISSSKGVVPIAAVEQYTRACNGPALEAGHST
jgi:hypothetical protein